MDNNEAAAIIVEMYGKYCANKGCSQETTKYGQAIAVACAALGAKEVKTNVNNYRSSGG